MLPSAGSDNGGMDYVMLPNAVGLFINSQVAERLICQHPIISGSSAVGETSEMHSRYWEQGQVLFSR